MIVGRAALGERTCTDVRWENHVNEVVPPSSSSGAGPLELEASAGTHLPPTFTHASELCVQMALSQVATPGRKRWLAEGKWYRMVQNERSEHRCKSAEGHLCCCFLWRRTVQITCGHDQLMTRHQRHVPCPPPSSLPTLCSDCAFILKISDLRSNQIEIQTKIVFCGV